MLPLSLPPSLSPSFHPSLPPSPSLSLSLPPSVVKPDLPENYESETCKKLREVIIAIQLQRSISYSLEELYQAVENMCSHKMAASLYSNLRVECERHIQSLVPVFERYPFKFLPHTCTCIYMCVHIKCVVKGIINFLNARFSTHTCGYEAF